MIKPEDSASGTIVPAHGPVGRDRAPLMLAALVAVFIMSHAFRTVVGIIAGPLTTDLGASAQGLGAAAGAFHLAFALAQPVVGIALDRYGPRRTVLVAFVLALAGSAVSAAADGMAMLLIGQSLIGFGCAPALLAALVFISRRYPAERFAALSGVVLAVGGLGMLITGTPLAWVVEHASWRAGFVALGLLAAAAWLGVLLWADDGPAPGPAVRQTLAATLRDLGSIVRQPHTAGICCLAAVSYASAMTLRGMWLGPLLSERHGFSLIEVGHVASAIPLALLVGPIVFGRIDPGAGARRALVIGCSVIYVAVFAALAIGAGATWDVALAVFSGFLSGYIALQYADVRSSYPPEVTGRALSVFTMAMFGGVATMQWLSGVAASLAPGLSVEPVRVALLTVCALLALGTFAFWRLPWPPR
jgi:MFS family permease